MRFEAAGWAVSLLLLFGGEAVAQDPDSGCDPSAIQAVSFLLGTWEVRSFERGRDGGWRESSASSSITMRLEGCVVEERWRGTLGGRPLRALNLLVYDRRDEEWDLAQVDSGHGNLNRMRGRMEEGRLVLFHSEYRRGRLLIDRTTFTPTAGGFDWLLETSSDAGGTWRPLWRMEYRREASR